MPRKKRPVEVPVEELRWTLDPATLPFETTEEIEPLEEIVGQDRGVAAFRFGMGVKKRGYNVLVTGAAGSGRMATVRKLLNGMAGKGPVPQDLCYVNNFKDPEAPILIRLEAGKGRKLKEAVSGLVSTLRKAIPQLFESQEYISLKKEIMEAYERKGKSFFKGLDQKVKEEGFALVDVQMGQVKRPEVVPLVDGNPMHLDQVEAMVEKGRFPREEFEAMKEKQARLREEIDQIFMELRDLQKEVQEKLEEMDRVTFMKNAGEMAAPILEEFRDDTVRDYIQAMLSDMGDNLQIFAPVPQPPVPGLQQLVPDVDQFQSYKVNLLVDNAEREGPPVIIESYPTYKNIFGSIERVFDRSGVWRTDYSRIKAGSLLKANGGYLVINLLDALVEPGVWYGLKRALKSQKLEIQTYDPFYIVTTSGLKPEPIDLEVKVVVVSDPRTYHILRYYDDDLGKIFKVRADFDTAMNRNEESIRQVARFIRTTTGEEDLRSFDRTAVAALVEQAVRMTGRKEKVSTGFPTLADLIREADFWAGEEGATVVKAAHVDKAVESRRYRSNMLEERLQEMIDRGTVMIDTEGEVVGQVNGLAVYSVGNYMFGKPSRITASTSMGRAGIINIEREADLSGSTHNKGVLIMAGYLRKKYAQDKPLSMSASIAFEQSYGGVDGDSASSTEVYALLSSLSEVPIRQSVAVTGSVNQKGEIQAIGGVNQKIEGFFDCCLRRGLTGDQGVMIPEANVQDLMLRKDVVEAVKKKKFHIYPVRTVDEGIEILTGKKAGERKADGSYPAGTINYLVDRKLRDLAEGLKNFGNKEESGVKKKGRAKKAGGGRKK
ncbi:MAG: AAA family ATPase [Deltaproteobacteria bacterium]|nr:AAA family ATPase [Deltaproteobacteria bacterium]MBW1924667.1 AAA family ATPase [Deltaproteobacteria bacterium]MBW1948120.1 AAA family ATPase [Deltaproteobacteria bacterium]MBW2008235.1 AAA family ATPase [Deltaproteobacteria bacterium]MBW2101978.1 AAA family ATPase [Deltaproteobacteria bacterium]